MLENLDAVFNWTVRVSLYSVGIVFIIVLTQALMRRALSARWNYALWLILLARLVLPAGPETKWSLWNLTPERWTSVSLLNFASDSSVQNAADITVPMAISMPAFAGGDQANIATTQSGGNRIPKSAINNGGFSVRDILRALPLIWLAGVLVMAAITAFVNLRLWNSVRGLDLTTDSKLLELFEDCKRRMHVKTVVELVVTDLVENPFLFGFIRPRVLFPADLVRRFSNDQLRCVFLHELAHLKRGDIATGWILASLQTLHWFNPVIWHAFYRMRSDRETAADALVLERIPDVARCNYGDVLIEMLDRCKYPRRMTAVAGILEDKTQLKRRLTMITGFKHSTRREIISATALFAVLSITLLSSPRTLLSQLSEQSIGNAEGDVQIPRTPRRLGPAVLKPQPIYKVDPIRPEGIHGMVELDVAIDEKGVVTEIVALGSNLVNSPALGSSRDFPMGHLMLRQAAIDAVRQWRYSPIILNGSPVPVIFNVLVPFSRDETGDADISSSFTYLMMKSNDINGGIFYPILISNNPRDTIERSTNSMRMPMQKFALESGGPSYLGPAILGISEPEIRFEMALLRKVREIVNADWPVDDGINDRAYVRVMVLINENGDIDGTLTLGDPKIPALEEALRSIQVQSPAYLDGEAVSSFIMIQVDAP